MRGLLLVLVSVAGCGAKKETGDPAPVAPPPPAAEVTVTGEQLYRDYRDGKPAAVDEKYIGKFVKVRGRVSAVEPHLGGYFVGVETGPNVVSGGAELKSAVVALVGPDAKDAVAQLKPLDDVVLIGKCAGKVADDARKGGIRITLTDARIEAHYPRP